MVPACPGATTPPPTSAADTSASPVTTGVPAGMPVTPAAAGVTQPATAPEGSNRRQQAAQPAEPPVIHQLWRERALQSIARRVAGVAAVGGRPRR